MLQKDSLNMVKIIATLLVFTGVYLVSSSYKITSMTKFHKPFHETDKMRNS